MGDLKFDWDDKNVSHLGRHRITPLEVEELFSRHPVFKFTDPVDGEERLLAYGVTARARLLTIAFTERRNLIRPITGWDMTRQESKTYAPQILGGH
jgi:uncharacterized DUF497 family protein